MKRCDKAVFLSFSVKANDTNIMFPDEFLKHFLHLFVFLFWAYLLPHGSFRPSQAEPIIKFGEKNDTEEEKSPSSHVFTRTEHERYTLKLATATALTFWHHLSKQKQRRKIGQLPTSGGNNIIEWNLSFKLENHPTRRGIFCTLVGALLPFLIMQYISQERFISAVLSWFPLIFANEWIHSHKFRIYFSAYLHALLYKLCRVNNWLKYHVFFGVSFCFSRICRRCLSEH